MLVGREYNREKKESHRPKNNGVKTTPLPERTREALAKKNEVVNFTTSFPE